MVPLRPLVAALVVAAAAAPLPAQSLLEGGPPAGRVLWLRADRGVGKDLGDLVTSWHDPLGGNLVISATANGLPEWRAAAVNGQPALHFDGNDVLWGYGMPTGSYTKVAVCQVDDLAPTNNVFSGFNWHALYFGGSDRARLFHGGDFVTSGTGIAPGQPVVLLATYDAATGDGRLYQDGVLVGSGNDQLVGNPDGGIVLGSFAFDFFFSGSIAEVAAWDRVLNDDEIARLHVTLMQRYHGDPPPAVVFTSLPQPGQVLQRDDQDEAQADVEGEIRSAGYDAVVVEITQDGQPFDQRRRALTYSGGVAPFAFHRTLVSGRHDYEIALFAERGARRRLLARVGHVAVGDVWLLHGQSNAVAADYWGEHLANADCQGPWVRSFGNATLGTDGPLDLHWSVADGESAYSHGSVGAWGLRLGQILQHRYDVPVGLINGAVGGTSIAQHQRSTTNPLDLTTIYGRMLHRVMHAGVKSTVRGLIWYQGESDGDNGAGWYSGWQSLRASWALDFPALKSLYLFQVRDNCAGGGRPVREAQRELIDLATDTYVMSTTAAPKHDGCHFQYEGYRELGDRIARVVGRDFYGSTDTQEIDPPNPLSATWNDAAHTQILITFRDPDDRLVLDPGAEANFFVDDNVPIVGGTIVGNTLLLQLARASTTATINYDGHPLDGPWFMNARGVGALTFFGVPVQ